MTAAKLIEAFMLEVELVARRAVVAGMFRSIGGLDVSYDVLEYREGGNNEFVHHLPGRVRYPNLVLAWGFTVDDVLQKWFFQTKERPQTQDVTVTLLARDGKQLAERRKWTFSDAFPVHWSGPTLTPGDESWTETLEIAHSGLKVV
jgi:phage tail-like protein